MDQWERSEGVVFLKKAGLKKGDVVLDFGTRIGHYTIPSAILAGESGKVYGLDRYKELLDQVNGRAEELGLENIITVNTKGSIILDFKDDFFDFIMLYDILHYFNKKEREALYENVYKVIKLEGIVSVYPKHLKDDRPDDNFEDMTLEQVIKEIENNQFKFIKKICATISHYDNLNHGCVINFMKK